MRKLLLVIMFLTGCASTQVNQEDILFKTTEGIKVDSRNGVVRVYAKLSQEDTVCTCFKDHKSYDMHELVCVCQDK